MRRIFFIGVLLSVTFFAKSQLHITRIDYDSSKLLTGYISDLNLRTDSAFKWFNRTQKIYNPKEKVVKVFAQNKDSIHLLIFMGTWCEDSHFVIPRFYKILDSAKFNKEHISLIAVDRNKKDDMHLADALHVNRVPTIIVYKNGKEQGRVVEYGNTGRYDEEVAALITGSL
ncbi:MAG: thioredoxin family protein [Niabella sp.]